MGDLLDSLKIRKILSLLEQHIEKTYYRTKIEYFLAETKHVPIIT